MKLQVQLHATDKHNRTMYIMLYISQTILAAQHAALLRSTGSSRVSWLSKNGQQPTDNKTKRTLTVVVSHCGEMS